MKEVNAKTEWELDNFIMTMALFNMGVSFHLTGSNKAELPSHQAAVVSVAFLIFWRAPNLSPEILGKNARQQSSCMTFIFMSELFRPLSRAEINVGRDQPWCITWPL